MQDNNPEGRPAGEECRQGTRENPSYQEVYHEPGMTESVVYDPESHRTMMRKVLDYGSPAVFEYLKTHGNRHIPKIWSWEPDSEDPRRMVVLEEFINGQRLSDLLAETPGPADDQKKHWLMELCDALEFLHRARPQIIHRDVKAENILITDDGTLKLIDYDAAKIYHPEETRDTVLLGTDGSAAPEQYGFGQSDDRTDIYAVGKLMQQMFPGHPELLRVAARASKLDPDDRYQDIGRLRDAVMDAYMLESSESFRRARANGETHAPDPGTRKKKANAYRSAPSYAEPAGKREKGPDPAGAERRREDHPVYHQKTAVRRKGSPGPIPGFRSGKLWKKIVALIGYACIIVTGITFPVSYGSHSERIGMKIGVLIWFLVIVDIVFTWSNTSRTLPGVLSDSFFVRFLAKLLWIAAAFFAMIVVLALLFEL